MHHVTTRDRDWLDFVEYYIFPNTVPFHSISRSRVTRTFGFTKGNACHAVTGKMSKWFWGKNFWLFFLRLHHEPE